MEESIKSKVVKGGISKVVGASVGTLVGKFVLLADPSLAAGTALILGKAIAEGCSASIAQSIYDDVSMTKAIIDNNLFMNQYFFNISFLF